MVAGLPKVVEHGALSIAASVRSSFRSSSSTSTNRTLRVSGIEAIVPVVWQSLRVEQTAQRQPKRAASCAGVMRGGGAVRPSPAFSRIAMR